MITGQKIKEAMIAKGIDRVNHHDCGLCGDMVFYSRIGEQLYFNSGCGCSRYWTPPEPQSWDDAANWINMQNDEWRGKLSQQFGLDGA